MKLIELVCSATLLTFFAGLCASVARPVERLVKESEQVAQEVSRDRFIVESFRKLCVKNVTRTAIDEWIGVCNGLYPDGHVTVMREGFDADGRIVLSCEWNTSEKGRRVFAVVCKET